MGVLLLFLHLLIRTSFLMGAGTCAQIVDTIDFVLEFLGAFLYLTIDYVAEFGDVRLTSAIVVATIAIVLALTAVSAQAASSLSVLRRAIQASYIDLLVKKRRATAFM